ncbi:MAG: carboxypeptidase-like regulatory domain-containing protein [bacterium]|nr:carboxypeptidase-like regulatory domain-containing protein [bacterium]
MQKPYTWVIGLLIVAFVGYGVYALSSKNTTPPGGQACTQEAKQCPDGSYVSRVAPSCEFAACPSTVGYGTIQGRVTLGPTCPVETVPPDPSCATQPYPYQTTVTATGGGRSVTVPTDAAGSFRVSLTPGTYTVSAAGGNNTFPSCAKAEQSVELKAGQTTTVDISCDTGIR